MYTDNVRIFNINIDNFYQKEFLEKLGRGGVVFTPNIDHLMKLQKDAEFYHAYQSASFRVCDSQILYWFSRFIGAPIKEKLSGSDLLPAFCNHYRDDDNFTIFLLGAAPGVAEKAAQRINKRVGRQIVIGTHSPSYGFENSEAECFEIIEKVNRSKASVLAIGVGTPKQEKWVAKYKKYLSHAEIILAIGATIDFEAGFVNRAPKWISELGLEWLYRLLQEPRRLSKRYLVEDLPFFGLILKQYLGLYQQPNFDTPSDDVSQYKTLSQYTAPSHSVQSTAQSGLGR